jgi:hypothetical protein
MQPIRAATVHLISLSCSRVVPRGSRCLPANRSGTRGQVHALAVQSGARRDGNPGIYGNPGIVESVTYRF